MDWREILWSPVSPGGSGQVQKVRRHCEWLIQPLLRLFSSGDLEASGKRHPIDVKMIAPFSDEVMKSLALMVLPCKSTFLRH